MSMFAKYKKYSNVDWGIETEGYKWVKPSEMPLDENIKIYGFFVCPDNGYGESGAAILDGEKLLSIPTRYVEQIRDMLGDDEIVNATKGEKVGIKVTTFTSKKHKKPGYDIEFVEL